jgi:hypothetical protein
VPISRRAAGVRRGLGAASLCVLLAASACARKGDAAKAVRDSDLRFLPRDTAGLAVLEVARFQDREAVVRWLDDFLRQSGGDHGAAAIGRALGKPLLEKVDRAALAVIPRQGSTSYAFLAEGPFEEKTVRGLTGENGLVTLFETAGSSDSGGSGEGAAPTDVSLLALPRNHLALGPRAVLEELRGRTAHPADGLLSGPLLPVLKHVDPQRQVWGGFDVAAIAALQAGAGQIPSQVPIATLAKNLRALAFEAAFDKTVDFDLVGLADGESGARTLADAARGLVAIARVSASQGAPGRAPAGAPPPAGTDPSPAAPADPARAWFDFLDALRIDQQGSEVRLRGRLDATTEHAFLSAAATPTAPAR